MRRVYGRACKHLSDDFSIDLRRKPVEQDLQREIFRMLYEQILEGGEML